MRINIIEKRSFDFAIVIIRMYERLINDKKEFILSKQLLRSGTSIGANVKEGLRGQSRKDFMAKMNIALKEANETEYWIKLLMETDYLNRNEDIKLLEECREICKILNSIVKSTKASLDN